MNRKVVSVLIWLALLPVAALGQANGKLQIHFMDVGQGDGALLISPFGETVLFDSGVRNQHHRPISYQDQLGVTTIDYHIASHYHDDHIGAAVQVLTRFPLQKQAIDRGGSYHTRTYDAYAALVEDQRATAIVGSSLTLDEGSPHPVRIEFVAMNGDGVSGAKDENDLSLVCVVRFGQFDAVFAGDLSGARTSKYRDIESAVAPMVGQVEVYKVNHHGSRHSSNANWMAAIAPKVAVISCGENNKYGHPHKEALERLDAAGVEGVYWTAMCNADTFRAGRHRFGGNVIVEIGSDETTFTVTWAGDQTEVYEVWNPVTAQTSFAWSRRSEVYHFSQCVYVRNISPANLETGTSPPDGKRLHIGCPK